MIVAFLADNRSFANPAQSLQLVFLVASGIRRCPDVPARSISAKLPGWLCRVLNRVRPFALCNQEQRLNQVQIGRMRTG